MTFGNEKTVSCSPENELPKFPRVVSSHIASNAGAPLVILVLAECVAYTGTQSHCLSVE